MEPIKILFVVLALFAIGLNSCKKSSSSPKVTNGLSLNFNDTAYKTSTVTAFIGLGYLTVIGTFNSTTNIRLITQNAKVGTFDISISGGVAASTFTMGTATEYFGDTGKITITSITSTAVSGTFSFQGTDLSNANTCTVTNGTFQSSL